jgi:hypothetical protein
MPFFVVTHNVTDSKFYKENVEAMIGSLPNCDPINEGLHKKDLHQLSVNFPSSANGDVKIGSASRRPMISLLFRAPRQRRPDDVTISARRAPVADDLAKPPNLSFRAPVPTQRRIIRARRPLDDSSARAVRTPTARRLIRARPPTARLRRWCVFESKPGSSWTAKSMKEWQDADKKPWAVQDVTEINCPVGHKPYYAQPAKKSSSCAIA